MKLEALQQNSPESHFARSCMRAVPSCGASLAALLLAVVAVGQDRANIPARHSVGMNQGTVIHEFILHMGAL
jgi:hypothetical protein